MHVAYAANLFECRIFFRARGRIPIPLQLNMEVKRGLNQKEKKNYIVECHRFLFSLKSLVTDTKFSSTSFVSINISPTQNNLVHAQSRTTKVNTCTLFLQLINATYRDLSAAVCDENIEVIHNS